MAHQVDHIILFEDDRVSNLYPLTLVRPAWDLLCGTGTLYDRVRWTFPKAKLGFWIRDYLMAHVAERFPGIPVNKPPKKKGILVNARLVDLSVLSDLPDAGEALFHDGIPMVAVFEVKQVAPWFQSGGTAAVLDGFNKVGEVPKSAVLEYPWDLTARNQRQIENDIGIRSSFKDFFGEADSQSVIRGKGNVSCGVGTTIGPLAVIDATTGSVIMGKNVTVEPHSFIRGPVYVGDNSVIWSHSRILGGTSIGPMCKVGGEIHSTIFQGYTNKQHDGFLGNSVVGSWCNLGAGTTVSNLKNNYRPVKVQIGDRLVDTGSLFVGSMIGDHSTTAIGTVLNTGSLIGVGCNIFGAGFPPRFIPSFHWGGAVTLVRQSLKTVISVVERMMARRDQTLSDTYRQLLDQVYRSTERDQALQTS